jgi:hypothetical protein
MKHSNKSRVMIGYPINTNSLSQNHLPLAIDENVTNKGKAYLQVMFEGYIKLNN